MRRRNNEGSTTNSDQATPAVANSDQPTPGLPAESADVDALLAESLKAQSEQDFIWKEPERTPRWWERAEAETSAQVSAVPQRPDSESPVSRSHHNGRVRIGSVVFGLATLVLAVWVITSVVFGITVEPVIIALVVSTLAGLALVATGLRPKPGTRI